MDADLRGLVGKWRADGSPYMADCADELEAALSVAQGQGFEYEFEIWQDDNMQAGGTASTLAEAESEAAHYLMMYGQDAPATAKFYERRELPAAPAQPDGVGK